MEAILCLKDCRVLLPLDQLDMSMCRQDIVNEFLAKLKVLLGEYNATIGWTCGQGSDTHGIYEDCIYVEIGNIEVYRTEDGSMQSRDIP